MRHRRLAGCVPIRLPEGPSNPEVLLITSRSNPLLLVFPKGGVKKGELPPEAAQRETFEEAGLRGSLLGRLSIPLPNTYSDDEVFCESEGMGSEESNRQCRWYVMLVEVESDWWPEKDQRCRRWFKLSEARKLDNLKKGTKDVLDKLSEFFSEGLGKFEKTPPSGRCITM